MKKRKKSEVKGPPSWMVTMGDMNNLLMCFFIIMMGDETVSVADDFRMAVSSFRGNIGMMEGGSSLSKGTLAEMGQTIMTLPSVDKGKALGKRLKKAAEIFKPEIEAKAVRVTEDERGLIISLASDLFFDSGSARLKPEMRPVLTKVSNIVRSVPNFVRIEGHTDSNVIRQTQLREGYRTNWELSASRSLAVLLYMTNEESVNPKQLSSVAFGEFRPIDNNNTPEGRAYNRRVDIVILKEKFVEASKDPNISKPLPDEEWR
ncbi:MAG: OmpA family protein [Spirochaetes bacterium]|nr:OmpA family protein [Spirochaetota bacterium]